MKEILQAFGSEIKMKSKVGVGTVKPYQAHRFPRFPRRTARTELHIVDRRFFFRTGMTKIEIV